MDDRGWAILSGVCATAGSNLGKISGQYDYLLVRLFILILMLCVNSVGFMLFAKSLNLSPSSLQPVLISTASSFLSSALLGFLLYGEVLSLFWWLGASLVILGMVILLKKD